ncbi:hypothetical protein ABTE85_22485, partial [Acinetobacter baumannii]
LDHPKRSSTGDAKNVVPLEHARKHPDNHHQKDANSAGHHSEHGQVKHAKQSELQPQGKAETQLLAPLAPAPSAPEAPVPGPA